MPHPRTSPAQGDLCEDTTIESENDVSLYRHRGHCEIMVRTDEIVYVPRRRVRGTGGPSPSSRGGLNAERPDISNAGLC